MSPLASALQRPRRRGRRGPATARATAAEQTRRSEPMTRRRYVMAALAAVMLVSGMMTGFMGSATAQEGDRPVLRFAVNAADLASLDPHFASGTQDRTVADMIYNALVRYVPGNT